MRLSVWWIAQEWFIFSNVRFFWRGSNTSWWVGAKPDSFVNSKRIGFCLLTHRTETSPLEVMHQTTPEKGQCNVGEETLHIWQLFYFALLVFLHPPPPPVLLFLSFIISVHQHLPWGGRSNQDGIVSLSCGKLCLGSTCQTLSDRGQSDFETLLMTLDSFSLTISSADLEEMYFILHTDDLSAGSCGFSDNVGIKCFKEHLKWALL